MARMSAKGHLPTTIRRLEQAKHVLLKGAQQPCVLHRAHAFDGGCAKMWQLASSLPPRSADRIKRAA
eukprot:6210825-Pleurochrysis_carterae.AAC.2